MPRHCSVSTDCRHSSNALATAIGSGAGNGMLSQGDGPGTIEPARQPSDGRPAFVEGRGLWARIEGAHGRFDPRTSTSATDYDLDTWKIQSGLDGQLYESESGKLIGSLTAQYGNASADISSLFGNGEIDTDGYGLGGTLTWHGQKGFYLDGQAQATRYESDLSSDVLGSLSNGNDGFGYAFSLETGKRLALNQSRTLTPQAQLAYSNVDFDAFADPFGANVSLGTGESLKGRLGLSADLPWRVLQERQPARTFTALPIFITSSWTGRKLKYQA